MIELDLKEAAAMINEKYFFIFQQPRKGPLYLHQEHEQSLRPSGFPMLNDPHLGLQHKAHVFIIDAIQKYVTKNYNNTCKYISLRAYTSRTFFGVRTNGHRSVLIFACLKNGNVM